MKICLWIEAFLESKNLKYTYTLLSIFFYIQYWFLFTASKRTLNKIYKCIAI